MILFDEFMNTELAKWLDSRNDISLSNSYGMTVLIPSLMQ